MGFTFQLALGVVLVFVTCCPTGYSGDVVPTTSTTENASLEKSDRNLNLIEKSPKTETELKNVNSNTHKNLTSLKLNKSEPYPKKDEKEKVDFVSSNVVPKQSEEDKENELKKDVGDKRENSSRSIDVTPKHSSDFHGKNVFTSPDMSDPEKYLDHVFEHGSASTEKFYDFDDMELTTPRSEYFDHRYKEAVYSLDKKLTDFDDHEDDSKEMSSESFDATPTAKFMGIQEMQNVVKNNTMGNKHSLHKDTLVMQVKRVNMVAHFNDTEYDDEDEDDKSKGENEKVETTTPRNHFVATTRKSISLTKPPVTNNSYILSNNIETDTVKAINIPIDETTKRVKGEGDNRSSSIDTKEQTIQENQIVPLQATTPSLTTTTTNILTTTVEERPEMTTKPNEYKEITTEVNENLVSTVEPVDESSGTIRIEETLTTTEDMKVIEPTSHEELVTNKDELTTAYESPTNTVRPETVSLTTDTTSKVTETTTKLEPHIEEIITTTPKEGFTLNDQPTSTSFKEVSSTYSAETTTTREDKKTVKTEQPLVASTTDRGDISTTPIDILTTETTVTVQETTTETTTVRYNEKTTENEIQTTEDLQEKTTESEVRTTDHGFRTSKSMAIPTLENDTVTPKELPSTLPPDVEIMSTTVKTTEVPTETVTESASPSSIITEKIPVAITTPLATEPPPVATTGDIFSTLRPRTTKFVSTGTEYPPIPFTTLTDTTPLPENYPTTQKASTMMNIVRIVTVDENRTTLVPRTLSPDVSYPTTDPAEANKSTEEPVITTEEPVITTTEFSTDTTGTEGAVTGDGPEDKKGTIAAIVISTVGAVCLILLAGLLYVMRKRQKRFNYGERCRPVSLDDYSVDNLSVYNSNTVAHPLNFPALAKFANNVDDIKAEFEEIPVITARTSELPEGCENKNRYANVIPLPETRVYLSPIEGYPNSDYINANYVNGPKTPKPTT
ncbi:hypothetical protein NQ317_015118 [Molorchus minor]|uniref:protein-tyrosine-phosphatase n=1 Tax=Molorchus minor TaxID=1323400 RepID=A0ABQ9K4U7_9CUCU|nr:hypothetical protein NQ317_015118 [Molorchus minor]